MKFKKRFGKISVTDYQQTTIREIEISKVVTANFVSTQQDLKTKISTIFFILFMQI